METLVLNTAWQPIGRISWERAVTQWVKGKIEIIDSYDDREIHSATFEMKMPCVVRELTGMVAKKKAIKFSRENVYTRDKGRCQYCGNKVPRPKATYDHVVPRAHGGKTKWTNVVIACFGCNQKKRDKTPEQAKMYLLSTPVKPNNLPDTIRLTFVWRSGMPKKWKDYLYDIKYWHTQLDEE